MKDKLNDACKALSDWLNKKINIPNCPEWLEGIIFNKMIKCLAVLIIASIKKLGGKKNG